MDTITDFKTAGQKDKIQLSETIFCAGSFAITQNATGTPSGTGRQIVYDNSGSGFGDLFWPPNGTAGTITKFTILSYTPASVAAGNFALVA